MTTGKEIVILPDATVQERVDGDSPVGWRSGRLIGSFRGGGLRARAMRGSAWTMGGYAAGQALRFVSNVAVSWILAVNTDDPARIFGLMFYVSTVLQGVQLFSDIGIGPSVIHEKRGEDEGFLRTAFTIQAVRGAVLWLIATSMAWPLALRYEEPLLGWLIPVSGISAVVMGLASTARYRVNRRLELRKVTLLQLLSQAIGAATILIWAVLSPTVWALASGGIAAAFAQAVGSHFLLRDRSDRFGFDAQAFSRLIRFGRWIFLATALTFLVKSLDRLLFPELVGFERLGVYYFAAQIVMVAIAAADMLSNRVVFPALAEVSRERPTGFLRKLEQARLAVIVPIAAVLLLLYLFGEVLIHAVYAAEYRAAGWMLQVAAAGAVFRVVGRTYSGAWLARGDSFTHMLMMAASVIALIATSLGGYWLAGERGFIVGLACAGVLAYPPIAAMAWRRGVWQWRLDGAVLGATILVVAIAQLLGFGVQW